MTNSNWVIYVHTGGLIIISVRGTNHILPTRFGKKKMGTLFGEPSIFHRSKPIIKETHAVLTLSNVKMNR